MPWRSDITGCLSSKWPPFPTHSNSRWYKMLLWRRLRAQVPTGIAQGPKYCSSDVTKNRLKSSGRGKSAWDKAKICGWTSRTPVSPPGRGPTAQAYSSPVARTPVCCDFGGSARPGLRAGLPTDSSGGEVGAELAPEEALLQSRDNSSKPVLV